MLTYFRQNCKKFNDVDKAAGRINSLLPTSALSHENHSINVPPDLPHPSIAIKYKKSLLANLGTTAITQMIILLLCSVVMVWVSITLIIPMVRLAQAYNSDCTATQPDSSTDDSCGVSKDEILKESLGTWGGKFPWKSYTRSTDF
jgi:hypothetical protein